MNKYLNIFILLGTLILACNSVQAQKKPGAAELSLEKSRGKAADFSLKIIKSYFKGNCRKYNRLIADSVFMLNGDGTVAKKNFKKVLCESLNNAVKDKSKSFDTYKKYYKIEVLTRQEIEQKLQFKLPAYIRSTPSDFFFLGYSLKPEYAKGPNFVWDDMFIFMVRLEKGRWKLKGLGG